MFFSLLQTTLPPYWQNEVASGDGSRPCIDCPCWLQTTENPPSAAQTRFRCAYVTVTRMAWPCLVEPWPTRQLALAPAPFWLFWAASLHFWVRAGWPQCQKHKALFQLFVFFLAVLFSIKVGVGSFNIGRRLQIQTLCSYFLFLLCGSSTQVLNVLLKHF